MKFLYKILDIEPSQATRVFLMLGMGFFMGIFLATLDVGALSLFLSTFSESEDLPVAFALAGTSGIVFTSIYNFFQSRVKYSILAVSTLIFMLTVLGGVQYAFSIYEDPEPVYFFIFVMVLPFNYLSLLIFWGIFGRIFTLRESKKIIGSIDTGQLLASILALFSIPILTRVLETQDLLTIASFAAVGLFMMVLLINYKNLMISLGERARGRIGYGKLLKSRYIVLMAGFVIVSAVAVSFVDYAFLSATGQQFDNEALPNFLALFEATVVIFSFLFQTFVTDRVIALYGLRFSLIINPLLIGVFTGLATLIGITFGYIKEGNEQFIFFFIIIAMSKLFVDSLKDALDGPSFKLYFLPIDTNIRFDVQTKIEGVITAFAGLLAGLLIIGINRVEFFTLLYITIFTLPLLAGWYLITNKMHKGYKDTLQDTLVRNREEKNAQIRQEFAVNQVLENEIKGEKITNIYYTLKLMNKLEPALYESSVIKLLNSTNEDLRKYAVNKIKFLNLQYEKDNEVRQLAQKALGETEDSEIISVNTDQLEKLGKSLDRNDRLTAARLLRVMASQQTIFVLLELLRDVDNEVRHEAIITARKVKRKETWPVLIEMIDSPEFGHAATSALIEAGEEVLPFLDMAFSKSGQRDSIKLKIISIIGRIGGERGVEMLWGKIDYPDKRVGAQILVWLRYFDYQAKSMRERNILFDLLDEAIAKTIWNLSALEELPESDEYKYLSGALEEEIEANFDHVYLLLSILYDPESIQLVRENIETGSSDGIAFAIELMDIFVDKDVKPKLFPLFDDLETIDKLRQLQVFFPREEYKPREVLNYLLNRSSDQANRWTKATALHAMAFLDELKVTKAMVAQLFNEDFLLQETAAWVIYHKDRNLFEKVASRLPEEDRKFLEDSISRNQLIEGLDDGAFLRIEMAMFMKETPILSGIRGHLLCDLAEGMRIIQMKNGDTYDIAERVEKKPVLVVAEGNIDIEFSDGSIEELKTKDIFGELFVLDTVVDTKFLHAKSDAIIFSISTNDFYSIMGNNHELVQDMINTVSARFETKKV